MLGRIVKFVVGAALAVSVSGCAVSLNSLTFAINADASLGDACRPINGVQRAFATSRLVMFGEVHGTREMPTFVGDAACHAVRHFGEVTVYLELREDSQPLIDTMAAGGDGTDLRLWMSKVGYGIGSEAMFDLLRRMRGLTKAGYRVKIVAMDKSFLQANQSDVHRDAVMARHIREGMRRSSGAHLVLAGNFHTIRRKLSSYVPAALHLEDLTPLTLLGSPSGGFAWNCRGTAPSDCGANQAPQWAEKIVDIAPWSIVLVADRPEAVPDRLKGYDGVFTVGVASASPPISAN